MDNFINFRMVAYTRGSTRVCRLHADLPKGEGLGYVFFVLHESELEQFASTTCVLSDGVHRLDVWGDVCCFYELDLPTGQKHGLAYVRYYSAVIPRFVRRLLLRMARQIWARGREEETTIDPGQERLGRWQRLYGVGSGNVVVAMSEDTRVFLEAKLGEFGSNLECRLEQVKAIARNSTNAFFEERTVQLSKDWDGFFFSMPGLHGGIVNHGREQPDWSIHT